MKHAVAYALIHHDGKKTWKIKDLSIFLRQYDECVEALREAVELWENKTIQGQEFLHRGNRCKELARQALLHATVPHA